MTVGADVPDYAPLLAAYHRAFAAELEAMVGSLPIRPGDRLLELACGDGAYTPWLAARVGPSGVVVGLDLSPGFLRLARREAANGGGGDGPDASTRFVAASIERLPFAADIFDVAWCAQSLFSLPDPLDAVRRMARVVKPGGLVAVLEADTLHQVLLPWPVDVELAVRTAEWEALRDESERPRKFYVGRRLVRVFRDAGLVDLRTRTYASDRVAPLDPDVRAFLREYLTELKGRVAPRLAPAIRAEFERLADPESPESLVDWPDLAVTMIDHVIHGRKPAG